MEKVKESSLWFFSRSVTTDGSVTTNGSFSCCCCDGGIREEVIFFCHAVEDGLETGDDGGEGGPLVGVLSPALG